MIDLQTYYSKKKTWPTTLYQHLIKASNPSFQK